MSMNRPPKCEGPDPSDREEAYVKLRFLSTIIGGIGKRLAKGEMDDSDIWAISMMIDDIADQIFPEWKEAQS